MSEQQKTAGYKVVPVEPTDEMLDAVSWPGIANFTYSAMLEAAPPAPSVPGGWRGLTDVEWMNIVNFDRAYSSYDKEEAVHEAVKRTEAKLKELNAAPTPAELLKTTNSVQISSSQVEAPSVPDEQLQAAFDRGFKAGNGQGIAQQIEIHKLHDLLAAPTQAEAPADVARDAARYRWLLDSNWYVGPDSFYCTGGGELEDYQNKNNSAERESLDAAVDAALEKARAQKARDEIIKLARDAERLDWLDERNAPHGLGWEIIQMPAGNVHIHTLTGDKAKFGSIRDAIDAAMSEKGGA